MEEDIRMSGIYVTRRVFQILFKPSVKPILVKYIQDEFGLSIADATQVVEAVNLLPASKRRAEDTFLVLGDRSVTNLTNTEFPDHQMKVLQKSRESGFRLGDFEGSIEKEPDPATLKRLLEMADFRKAYELNSALTSESSKVQIESKSETDGLEPEQWSSYGPVVKTLDEFNGAYVSFRSRLLSFVEKSATMPKEVEIATQAKAQ